MLGEIHGQLTQNSFHFTNRSRPVDYSPHAFAQSLLSDFIGMIIPVWRQFVSNQWAAKVVLISSMIPKGLVLYSTRLPEGGGFQGDDSLPSFCCFVLSLSTGYGGKSRNGSLHFAGVPEGSSADSRIEGSLLTDFRNFGDTLLSRYGTSGSNDSAIYGIYSRKLGDTRHAGPPVRIEHDTEGFYAVTSTLASNEVGTINKRKLHRGE